MSDFVHLHNHTHYSLQDGACTVDALVGAAKKNNMPAVALTDHGVMYGIAEFYKTAIKQGIKEWKPTLLKRAAEKIGEVQII